MMDVSKSTYIRSNFCSILPIYNITIILARYLMIKRGGGADYAHNITTCPLAPDFQTFLWPYLPMSTNLPKQYLDNV